MARLGRQATFRGMAAFFVTALLGWGAMVGSPAAEATGVCGYVRTYSPSMSVPIVSYCTQTSHPRCFPGTGGTVLWVAEDWICVTP